MTLLRDLSKSRRRCVARLCFQPTCLGQIEYRRLLTFIVELILKRQTRIVHELTVVLHDLYLVGVLSCKLCILAHYMTSKAFLLSLICPAIQRH